MKIVFSRKGFDSQYGRVPSPLFPDGTALSLPIPGDGPTRFRDLRWRGRSLQSLVESLSKCRVRGGHRCHLDPDIRANALQRPPRWRPAFGQAGAAQGHLANEGIGPGDLFLFFGWFRPVERDDHRIWRYVKDTASVHRLWGWLQVEEVIHVGNNLVRTRAAYPWLSTHPHLRGKGWLSSNTVYVATRKLRINGIKTSHAGGGVFAPDATGDRLTLTAPRSANRTRWRLPAWFVPTDGRHLLSCHREKSRWRRRGPWAYVTTNDIGQEFVFDVSGIREASRWLRELFTR